MRHPRPLPRGLALAAALAFTAALAPRVARAQRPSAEEPPPDDACDRAPETPGCAPALYRLAARHHALQLFALAAGEYERYAESVHADATRRDAEAIPWAAEALRRAVVFRI